jgi:hypothetical protein
VPRLLLLVIAATAASYPIGLAAGNRWLLPLLNAAPAYAMMAVVLRRGDRRRAVPLMLAWAASMALFCTLAFRLAPRDPAPLVLHGPAYRDEMFEWIRTGVGAESSPRRFVPQHAVHLAAFVALSLLTGSTVSVLMGAILMNYMDYYVASLGRAGAPAWAVALLGWQPWALCRVAAFAVLGVALAEPVLSRALRYRYGGLSASRRYLAWAAALLVADVALKTVLAPLWGRWLRAVLAG